MCTLVPPKGTSTCAEEQLGVYDRFPHGSLNSRVYALDPGARDEKLNITTKWNNCTRNFDVCQETTDRRYGQGARFFATLGQRSTQWDRSRKLDAFDKDRKLQSNAQVFRYPPVNIQHAALLCFRFPLRFRGVEEMMAESEIDVSYVSARRCC
jgi:hypothetical protein